MTANALQTLTVDRYLSLPIPRDLCNRSLALARRFYEQPLSERFSLAAANGRDFFGYVPSEREILESGNSWPVFSGSRARGYSSYDFASEPQAFSACGLKCTNKWPEDLAFKQDIEALNEALRVFTKRVSVELFESLDATIGAAFPADALNDPTCSMTRFLLYGDSQVEGISKAHTDYEFLAILISKQRGLEIQRADGSWHEVPLTDSHCIVLPGDMFAIASRGQIKATPHRVKYGKMRRLSVIHFQGLKYQTKIPYPGNNSDVTFGDHICGMKIRGTPHLERAWECGEIQLTCNVPLKNPLSTNAISPFAATPFSKS
jgi:isopenicillin N synthase-like dioxygenase